MPRRTRGEAEFNGIRLVFNDNVALLGMLDEIFVRQNYLFSSVNDRPLILDCGANIGVGVAYFKSIFPNAIIHAFEPDETAYRCLAENVARNNYQDVVLHQKAVWTRNEALQFFPDGSWGGGLHAKDGATGVAVEALAGRRSLAPTRSLINNIGLDGTGVHCSQWVIDPFTVEPSLTPVCVAPIPHMLDAEFDKALQGFFRRSRMLRYVNAVYRLASKALMKFEIKLERFNGKR